MHLKDADITADSIGPDQTAGRGLHCLSSPVCPNSTYSITVLVWEESEMHVFCIFSSAYLKAYW